jgi:hypothetical protein
MSGFEDYRHELADLDHEIAHYASVCGIDINDRAALEHCLADVHAGWAADKARQSLRGLVVLRIKIETEMLGEGLQPPPIQAAHPPG